MGKYLMQRTLLFYSVIYGTLLGMSLQCVASDPIAASNKRAPSVAHAKGSAYSRFFNWMRKQYGATRSDIKFLWSYSLKKVRGQKVTEKETKRAKHIAKKIGITLVSVAAIVATSLGFRWLFRKVRAFPGVVRATNRLATEVEIMRNFIDFFGDPLAIAMLYANHEEV